MYYGCRLADYSDSSIFNDLIYFIFYLSILYDYIYIQSAHGNMRRLSNPVTFLSLSQARTWVSNAISGNLFCVQCFEVRGCFALLISVESLTNTL